MLLWKLFHTLLKQLQSDNDLVVKKKLPSRELEVEIGKVSHFNTGTFGHATFLESVTHQNQ